MNHIHKILQVKLEKKNEKKIFLSYSNPISNFYIFSGVVQSENIKVEPDINLIMSSRI